MMTATPRETLDDILEGVGCAYERRVPLGPLTWYGVGGSAQRLAHPADAEELAALARACHSSQTPIRVLGKGANLIVVEGDVPGVVVQLDGLKQVAIDPPTGLVTAGGGADLEKLITLTVREGLGGLEALAGIPATIGGALRMNAGGAFGSIGPLVESVSIVETDGSRITLRRDELEFTYRRSNLTGRIVAEAVFRLDRVSDRAALRDRLKEVMRYKKASQPMAASHSAFVEDDKVRVDA